MEKEKDRPRRKREQLRRVISKVRMSVTHITEHQVPILRIVFTSKLLTHVKKVYIKYLTICF